jgi:hypothetical protein
MATPKNLPRKSLREREKVGEIDFSGGGLGIIYILTDHQKRLSKIGRTSAGTATGRAISYGKSHGHSWSVVAEFSTQRVNEVEANIHAQLAYCRVKTETGAREIFRIKPSEADSLVRSLICHHNDPAALRKHLERVRARLRQQYRWLTTHSGYSTGETIQREIYVPLLALDALERGITFDEMKCIYKKMRDKRKKEEARIQTDFNTKREAEWKAMSVWSKLGTFWNAPRPTDKPDEKIDDTKFPRAPYYANVILETEECRARNAARRAAKA